MFLSREIDFSMLYTAAFLVNSGSHIFFQYYFQVERHKNSVFPKIQNNYLAYFIMGTTNTRRDIYW